MKKYFINIIWILVLCVLCGCGNGDSVIYHMEESAVSASSEERDLDRSTDSSDAVSSKAESNSSKPDASTQEAKPVQEVQRTEDTTQSSSQAVRETGVIYVYVCGAVNHPGVYQFRSGSRVYEAIAAAGGLSEDADDKSLNQAQMLQDGAQITVYTKEEAAQLPQQSSGDGTRSGDADTGDTGAAVGAEGSGKVNLNTADKELLMTLPGIGASRADAIIAYRTEHGGFSSIEEIQNIDGIKTKAFNKIKDNIEV